MSIHVCKCHHKFDREAVGREEYHLRYPGMSKEEAQDIADRINAGCLLPLSAKEPLDGVLCGEEAQEEPSTWQKMPKEPFNEALDILKSVRDGDIDNCHAYRLLIDAASLLVHE